MRNPFFGFLQHFAISFVFYGDAYKALNCSYSHPFRGNFIVGMNTPLFFVIGGDFAVRTFKMCDLKELGRHLISYLWPGVTNRMDQARKSV